MASKYGIDNTPNCEIIESLISLCTNVLEPVRSIYNKPIIITSGYRCKELNKKIKGSRNSQHMYGEAADFELLSNNISLHDLWRKIVLSDIPYDQCILEFPPRGWIHISHVKDGKQRKKNTIAKHENYNVVYRHYTQKEIENNEYEV